MSKEKFPFLNLRHLFISFVEKYHPFNIRYFKVLVGIVMTLLLSTVLVLGWMSSKKIGDTVTEDFNQQQLVIARHVARQIENSLNTLKRELMLLNLSPSIQYYESASMGNRMETAFSSIKDEGAVEIRFIEDKTTKEVFHIIENHKCISENLSADDLRYLEWAQKEEKHGNILLTSVPPATYKDQPQNPFIKLILPVWQVSVDESHLTAPNKFSGVLVFVVDVSKLIENIAKEIRSGKTGYSWIIDENGTFLFHQHSSLFSYLGVKPKQYTLQNF